MFQSAIRLLFFSAMKDLGFCAFPNYSGGMKRNAFDNK